MIEILKTLKKYIIGMLFVIVLLVVQAKCDLALPEYTSNILNVGIQQKGVNETIYEIVRPSILNNISKISNDTTIYNYYDLIKKNDKDYIKKYPILSETDLYILKKDVNKNDLKKYRAAILFYFNIVNNEKMDETNLNYVLNDPNIKDNIDKINDMEEGLLNQYVINAISYEYEIIGVSLKDKQMNYLFYTGSRMILLSLVVMVIIIISTYLSGYIGASFARDIRSKVVTRIMSFSKREFNEFKTSSLITRCTNDVQQFQMMITLFLRMVLYAPIVGIGAIFKVANLNMSWVIALGVLAVLILLITLMSIGMPKFKIVQSLIDRMNLIIRETLNGTLVIRAFANEDYEKKKFMKSNRDLMKVNLFTQRLMGLMGPMMMLIMNGLCILIYWVGLSHIDNGTMQIGTIVALINYSMQIIMSFFMLSMMSVFAPRAIISIKRVSEVLSKESSIKDVKNPKIQISDKRGEIEFKNVSFKYPDGESMVLDDLSFKINRGEYVAIIGSTGSGKSSIVNLIMRFFDVTKGSITVGGVDIREQKLSDLRKSISYVPQVGYLFSGTIESNIKFGNELMSDEDMILASQVSCSEEFIDKKDLKYNEPISQGGTNVSGGQRQRLSIARALASRPDILVFDDSFSALDYKTDATLRKNLNEHYKDMTKIVVAQRVATVMNADKIIVLDQGKMVAIGTHDELLKNSNVYREIALSQLRMEELS